MVAGTSGGTRCEAGPCLSSGVIGRTRIRPKECSYLRVIKSSGKHEGVGGSHLYCQLLVSESQLSADVWSANGRSGRGVMQHSKGRENQPCSILKDELPAPLPTDLHNHPIVAATNARVLPALFGVLLRNVLSNFEYV